MKYSVSINNKPYVVEIEDINMRPVIAYVNGQRFEVIPDMNPLGVEEQAKVKKEAKEVHSFDLRKPVTSLNPNEMTAPLPGTVIEVFVRAGDVIEAGQVIVIIEAMKMKNSIRSIRAGKISEVLVSAMQTVAHKQVLVKFEV
jgi:glutaconyl-CoA/methylmalonyl-CoA decarboxylase subunit gamma